MQALVARYLGLACALLLVPPPGWCCLTPAPAKADRPAGPAPSCCCGRAPASHDQAPRPPRDHSRCGCAERHAPTLDPPYLPIPDAGLVAFILPVLPDSPAQALLGAAGAVPPDPSPPLNILHCLWLC